MARKKKINYSKRLCCFDIETSSDIVDGERVLYTWHWQALIDDEYYIFTSWKDCLDTMVSWCDSERLIVFVHNLSYETEAIIRNLNGHEITEIFASDTHKMLKFLLDDKLEFRCSYFLTNKSLAACGADVKCNKLEMDYQKIRKPGDNPNGNDELYCFFDVRIMQLKIRQLEEQEGIPFWDFPLTNTGFLRNELRKAMRQNPDNRKIFKRTALQAHVFKLCNDAFMGGYCHSNHIWTAETLHNVHSFDYGSAYPFAMLAHKFPIDGFHRVDNATFEDIQTLNKKKDILYIAHVFLKGVHSRRFNTYLSYSKCKASGEVLDNGRIYSADLIETTVTCLDLLIIMRCYKIDSIAVQELYWCRSGYLPNEFLKVMLSYYEKKQSLKGVKGEELNYMKSKNRVNSFYGMTVTMPIHDEIILDGTEWDKNRLDFSNEEIIQAELDTFYKSWNSFLPYQWGVFVPAYTRYHLWHDFILRRDANGEYPCDYYSAYFDTDSAKVLDREKVQFAIDEYNKWAMETRQKRLKDLGIDKDFPDLGYFDYEGKWDGFKTLGAKKYCVHMNGKFYTTVSGLSKAAGQYIRTFDDFSPGTIFDADTSGRTASHCIDNPAGIFDNDGGGCWIENVTYKLGISDDFGESLYYDDRFSYSRLTIHKDSYEIREYEEEHDENYIDLKVIRDKRLLYGVDI